MFFIIFFLKLFLLSCSTQQDKQFDPLDSFVPSTNKDVQAYDSEEEVSVHTLDKDERSIFD